MSPLQKSILLMAMLATLSAQAAGKVTIADEDEDDDAPETRSSKVGLSVTVGESEYKSLELAVNLGLSPAWQLRGVFTGTDNGDDSRTREGKAGFDVEASESFSFELMALVRSEPNSLTVKGLSPELSWALSSLWSGERETRLSVGVDGNAYTQTFAKAAAAKRLSKATIFQGAGNLGVTQELTDTLSLNASYSQYFYPAKEEKLLNAIVNGRKLQYAGIAGVVSGFPVRAVTAGLSWNPWDPWTFSTTFSNSTTVTEGPATNSLTASVSWNFVKSWTATVEANGSVTDGETSGLGTVGLDYRW